MTIEDLILKALDQSLETAEGEQRRLFLWMKAALQYPGLEEFIEEVKRAGQGLGQVSRDSLHKALEFAESHNEFQIQSLPTSYENKQEMTRLEKIRLREVEVRMEGILVYLGWLQR